METRDEDHTQGVVSLVIQDILAQHIITFVQNATHGVISKKYVVVIVENQTLL